MCLNEKEQRTIGNKEKLYVLERLDFGKSTAAKIFL
jgi:hypothetical protein